MLPALALLVAAALGRVVYPAALERRQKRVRRLGDDGVIVGAEPIERRLADAPGVLLFHGAGDTPQVLAGLADHLHARGFSVRVPLLSAHGRALSALREASATQWRDEVRAELAAMRSRHAWVGIVGLSMGGALALSLAGELADVDALVLLAPYVEMPPMIRRLAETSAAWEWLVPYFSSRGGESIQDPAARDGALGHGILTPAVLRALRDVVDAAIAALPSVRAPTLVIQSREDNRIPPESAERAFARLGAAEKRFIWTSGAGHVITVDFGHQRVYELTTRWLEQHGRTSDRGRRPRIKL
jgi:carboxylesterase